MRHPRDGVDDIVALFNLYEQKMYHIAFSILYDCYQAEDAVMDAFMRLLEKQYHIDDPASAAVTLRLSLSRICFYLDKYVE